MATPTIYEISILGKVSAFRLRQRKSACQGPGPRARANQGSVVPMSGTHVVPVARVEL